MTQIHRAALADDAVRQILATQWAGTPALILDSPPGAGKTGVAERLSVQGLALMHQRVMIATQTNEQGFDLGRRLGGGFSNLQFYMMTSKKLEIPPNCQRRSKIVSARRRKIASLSGR